MVRGKGRGVELINDGSQMAKSQEEIASEACTRAGAFALLLSLALATLIPLWLNRKNEVSLGRYLGLRLNLIAAIDALDDDPLWNEYKRSHDVDQIALDQLLNLHINSATLTSPDNQVPSRPKLKANNSSKHPTRASLTPEPPSGLGFDVTFHEFQQMATYLVQLNNTELLTNARNASDLFNVSIYRWVLKRDNLIAQNLYKTAHAVAVTGGSDPGSPANFAGAADEKALLRLPLSAVRDLAKAELPSIANNVKLGPRENEVEVSTGSLPKTLYGASLAGQLLLFVVIIYFAAFTRSAVSGAMRFPSDGTFFGTFAGIRLTLAVFFVSLLVPLIVSIGIFLSAYGTTSAWQRLGLAVCSVLMAIAVLSVYASLSSKSYFRPLHNFTD